MRFSGGIVDVDDRQAIDIPRLDRAARVSKGSFRQGPGSTRRSLPRPAFAGMACFAEGVQFGAAFGERTFHTPESHRQQVDTCRPRES